MRVTDEAIKCTRCGSKDLYKLRDSDIKIPVVDSSATTHRKKYKDVKVAGEKDVRPKDNAKTSGITKKAYKKVEIVEQPEVMEQFCDELKKQTGLWLTFGKDFRGNGKHFVRMNVATSFANVVDGCNRLKEFLSKK